MGFLQAYKMAVKSIRNNKVRSFLTMLGVIIGVSSVIAAVAFAQGSTKNVTDSISRLGTNLIQINIVGRNSNRSISYGDLKKFSEENSEDIAAIAPRVTSNGTVKYGIKNTETSIIGTSPEYEEINSLHVQSGRFILDMDVDYLQKVALVGTAVVNELFEGQNPLGKSIKINGQIFKIVGVLEERDGGQDQSEDDQIIIPVTVSQRLMQSAIIRNFAIKATTPETIDSAMKKLNALLFKVYKDENVYRVFNQAEALSTLNEVTDSMTAVLAGIAAISLIVGGIGIMNIMLVSVTERTREIGIRKAIGAKRKNILIQFLIEAVLVTGIGGCIGVLTGVGIIRFIIDGMDIAPAVYSVPWMVLSFGISLLVGVIFGMFPAYKAACLNPIEALRHE
jgi:putative ABC transport system permease protein